MEKKDFKKINNYLWEIPVSWRADMRVPARFYVSEEMLDSVLRDNSLNQLVNVATLPGIQRYALAMPDMHEGYASPIGGVAAISTADGIISPGMCVSGSTKVLHSLGYYRPIKEFADKQSEEIACVQFNKKKLEKTLISRFFKIKINPSIFKVTTKTGHIIECTGDHPFYTPHGMIPLKDIKIGDKIAIYPFEGVPYQEPQEIILVDKEKIKELWINLNQNPNGHGLEEIINRLEKNNLLPLKTTSYQFPILLKILGYLWGDGTIYFKNKRKRGRISFYGKREDLILIKKDLKKINFNAYLQSRKRKHKITTLYKTYSFENQEASLNLASTSLAILLQALGAPVGNKTRQNFSLPQWFFRLPLWQKRLFLAGFFGAELSSPKIITKHNFNFYMPVLSLNKEEGYQKNGKNFLKEIAKVLNEFGVKTKKITQRKEQINKNGKQSYRIRLILSSQPESLLNLFGKINYEYNQEKQFLANLAIHFIKAKQKLISKGGTKLARPFVGQFPTFKKFIKLATQNLGKGGLVWDEIEKIEKNPFADYVYDFTVAHPSHNFIANNFVVSNCGYDINCGMKLLKSEYSEKEIKPYIEKLASEIQKEVPSGLGRGRQIKLSLTQIDQLLQGGAKKLVEQGYGEKADIENCEANGCLEWADASAVSSHAKNRGRDQVGTLGSGNHFAEIQKVDQIFDENIAKAFGLFKDQIVIMIHTGSRGLGHQVCTDYLREFIPLMINKYKIKVPDKEFACVPFKSTEGQKYFAAMAAAANYAWANRQMIAYFVRKAWQNVLGKATPLIALYDVAHNIIKKEKYQINGKEIEVAVHRKGATRAFPPGHPEIPLHYQSIGQPVLIPGSMGTASYVLVGVPTGEATFFSTCHGAGRTMSRHAALRTITGQTVINQLKSKGIIVKCQSQRGIAEEAPLAYKDIESVVEVVHQAGLSRKVARLVPLAVIKGE